MASSRYRCVSNGGRLSFKCGALFSLVCSVVLLCISSSAIANVTAKEVQDHSTASTKNGSSSEKLGPRAVIQPGMSAIQKIKKDCASYSFPQLGECFYTAMAKSGAPEQALRFIQMTGNEGFIRDFRRVGPVDIAYAYFPFRANENEVSFFVNGNPSIINMDDLKLLPFGEMKKDKTYMELSKEYPELSLWPRDRSGTSYPEVKKQKEGGVQFVVEYYIRNKCHACTIIGKVHFSFNFNPEGDFAGVQFVDVTGVR